MVAPVPPDATIPTISNNVSACAESTPLFGPITHLAKIAPGTWSFRLWSPFKRNQILRSPIIKKWMARVSPLEPATGTTDPTARVLYDKGPSPVTTEDIEFAFARRTPQDVPPVSATAQYVNPSTEQAEQKWLLGFNYPPEATIFNERKQWIVSAVEIPNTALGVRTCRGPDPPKKKNDNTQAKRGGRGNGRGGKRK